MFVVAMTFPDGCCTTVIPNWTWSQAALRLMAGQPVSVPAPVPHWLGQTFAATAATGAGCTVAQL